jgi:hypothetical protein
LTGQADHPSGSRQQERHKRCRADDMENANSKTISRLMIIVFVGLAFAFGAAMLMSSHDGSLFADMAVS